MATAVTKAADILCPTVSWNDLVDQAKPGDIIFEWSDNLIADEIEGITKGPSHVLQIADFPEYDNQLYEFEAVFIYGVRLLPLSHYKHDKGYRVLCSRKGITSSDVRTVIGAALTMLGRKYEIVEEVEIALQKLAPWVKVGETDNRVFCSGFVQYNFSKSSCAFEAYKGNAVPEFLFLDPKTEVICKSNS